MRAGPLRRLEWHLDDPRRAPFASMLGKVWERYDRPMIVSETSHVGQGRPRWLDNVVDDVTLALAAGVPVQGICLYPVIDRPDWNDPGHWHNSGLWDAGSDASHPDAALQRRLHLGYAKSLRRAQRRVALSAPIARGEMRDARRSAASAPALVG